MRTPAAVLLFVFFFVGCGDAFSPVAEVPETGGLEPLSVYTVNYPLQYFAARIGGDLVMVEFPGPDDEDPAYWKPTADDIAAFQGADLIILNGAGYAKWLGIAALPESKLIETSAAFAGDLIPLEEGPVHTHGPQGEHSHKGTAFTTWLDPDLAIEQAAAITEALVRARPDKEEAIRERYDELEADLRSLSSEIEGITAGQGATALLFSHPVYQYLQQRYDLSARAVHWEPEEMPSAEQWRDLDELLVEHPAEWMIWEDAPSDEIEAELESRGIQSVVYRTCANVPSDGDYLSAMRQNVQQLETIFAD